MSKKNMFYVATIGVIAMLLLYLIFDKLLIIFIVGFIYFFCAFLSLGYINYKYEKAFTKEANKTQNEIMKQLDETMLNFRKEIEAEKREEIAELKGQLEVKQARTNQDIYLDKIKTKNIDDKY